MPQGRANMQSRATRSLSERQPRQLEDNQKLVEEPDGSVWLHETFVRMLRNPATGKMEPDERVRTKRVDSEEDMNAIARGEIIWWKALLEEQNKPAPKANRKREVKNESGE